MRLTFRSAQHPTCPLCRESVYLLETRSCDGCRTHYHQACLEEFTGCSTLGCVSTTYVEAELSSAGLPLQPAPTSGAEAAARIRVSERRPSPPSQIWLGAVRTAAAVRALAAEAREKLRTPTAIDAVSRAIVVGLIACMVLLAYEGLRSLAGLSFSDFLGIGFALFALGMVVFAAHSVSSRGA